MAMNIPISFQMSDKTFFLGVRLERPRAPENGGAMRL